MKKIDSQTLHDFLIACIEKQGTEFGSAINILGSIQDQYRYIPIEALFELSRITNWSFADLCSLVSSFKDLTTEPVGKHLILVCDGTACHTLGSLDLVKALEDRLSVKCGKTSKDGMFTLKSVYCVGACSLAPILSIDGKSHGKIRLIEISELCSELLDEQDRQEQEHTTDTDQAQTNQVERLHDG